LAMPRLTHGDGSGCSVRGKAEAAAAAGWRLCAKHTTRHGTTHSRWYS
jgi:hypothetical protein